MSIELTLLALSTIWLLVQFALYAVPANLELGSRYLLTPRDTPLPKPLSLRTARLGRAFENHVQWLPIFAIAIAVIEMSGQNSTFTALCAWAYLGARIAYVPAYVLGWNPWRSGIWAVGFLATALMLLAGLI